MSKYEINLLRAMWRTASYSNSNGECVEVAELDGGHWVVRDSKDRFGPVLAVANGQWAAFTDAVRLDRFG